MAMAEINPMANSRGVLNVRCPFQRLAIKLISNTANGKIISIAVTEKNAAVAAPKPVANMCGPQTIKLRPPVTNKAMTERR